MSREKKISKILSQYRSVFDSPNGKAVLYDMMKSNHVLSGAFVPGDPYTSAMHEGQRSVVIKLLALLETDPEKFLNTVKQMEDDHVD